MNALNRKSIVPLLMVLSLPAFAEGPNIATALPSLAPMVDTVKGAVVNVDVTARRNASQEPGDEEPMERFFGQRGGGQQQQQQLQQGAGSGFVVDPRGLIITNNHVIENAVNIRVRFEDGRSFEAEVLGRDQLTDVALIKLKGKVEGLTALKLGESSQMRVGDWVVAIGNPYGLASSVSLGIISALGRNIHAGPFDEFLQTDAAINPGNSGGPLLNLKGEVVGMNTAIVQRATGIGFAVPSALIKALVPQLEQAGSVTRGWLGVGIQDFTAPMGKAFGVSVQEGALITLVNEGSPAKKAGLMEDDVVVAIDGDKVGGSDAFRRVVALKRPDSTTALSLYRNGKPLEVKVKLGTRPDLENLASKEAPRQSKDDRQLKVGISFQDMDPRLAQGTGLPKLGALILDVVPGSPADRAGLRRGMLVVEANKKAIRSRDDFMKSLSESKSGSVVLLRVYQPGAGEGRFVYALEMP